MFQLDLLPPSVSSLFLFVSLWILWFCFARSNSILASFSFFNQYSSPPAVLALNQSKARTAGGDEYWLKKLNDARIEFDLAKQNHKIHKETKRNKLLTLGGSKSNWNIT